MLRRFTKLDLFRQNIFKIILAAVLFLTLPAIVSAQTKENSQTGSNDQAVLENQTNSAQTGGQTTTAVLVPVLKNYKEVIIGMPADDVREKLGKPKLDDQKSFFYQFNDNESAQILFDSNKNVRVISMMYLDQNGTAPKPSDIFGTGMEIKPNEEGALYKMVRYPDAGYIVVYSRSAGDNPMVVVTMQKI